MSPLAVYEVRKQFWPLPTRARRSAEEQLAGLLSEWEDVVTGWSEAIDSALVIAREYHERLAVDSADTLHVGWGQAEECSMFGSFDISSGTRALAHARGLKLWPERTERDSQQFARLKA